MTVRHLLTHTSGIDIADDFTDTGDDDGCLERYVDEVVTGTELIDPVGWRWSYANGGYSVLGRLVEVVGGSTWDDLIDEWVFTPAEMAATTRRRGEERGAVSGHHLDHSGELVVDDRTMPSSAGPAGNVVADVASLVRFASALLIDQKLLPAALVDEMVTPQASMRSGAYGFGLTIPVPGVVTHRGATIGHTAFLGCVPALGGALAVLANGPGAGTVAASIQAQLFGMPDNAIPTAPGSVSAPPFEKLTGSYRRRDVHVEVTTDGTRLQATIRRSGAAAELFGDEPTVVLEPHGGTRFTSTRPDGRGTDIWDFLEPDAQEVPSVLLTERTHRRVT